MNTTAATKAGVAVTATTVALRRALKKRRLTGKDKDPTGWRVVTVALDEESLHPGGQWPEPLEAWGDAIEVRTRPASGNKGTELAARLRRASPRTVPEGRDGTTPVQKLRSSLRRAKQLLETGEVLRATEPGTTQPRLSNAPLRAAIKESGGVGRR
jgi:hypothetical protein